MPPTFVGAAGWGYSTFRLLAAHFVVLSWDGISANSYATFGLFDGENEE
jgi:hypothetical protein